MPVIKYDYLARPHIENSKLVVICRPIIAVRLSANYKMYPTVINCLVDSGADFNLMPADIGEYLGLNIKKGKKSLHREIGDIDIVAYIHPVTIFLQGYNFKTEIHFSYVHRIPLLGR
ncbi:MAG: hypothetical protein AAB583_05405 [Patescibacteria group bacterium]